MVLRPRNGLSLCAGGGGLDMGLGLAEPDFHTRAYVEWEEYPRASIIAAQRAGYFAPAPIWGDLTTFDARPFRGAMDTVLAGYPCQPFSAAGKRLGEDDPRHLWPHVARIIDELQPEWVFLENVSGHVSLGAEAVLRTLWDMGFAPATGIFSAGETGAPHERQRWFCVAHCNRDDRGTDGGKSDTGPDRGHDTGRGGGTQMGHSNSGLDARGLDRGRLEGAAAGSSGRNTGEGQASLGQRLRAEPRGTGGNVDHTASPRRDAARVGPSSNREGRECLPGNGRDELADASGARTAPRGPEPHRGQQGVATQPLDYRRPLAPPGPGDRSAWATVMASARDLAPSGSLRDIHTWARDLEAATGQRWEAALKPALRRMADGLASRSQPLRLLGNGVHPLAAGYAWRTLSSAHGLRPMDLDAFCESETASAA